MARIRSLSSHPRVASCRWAEYNCTTISAGRKTVRGSLAGELADRLRQQIIDGELEVGARLPPEPELAAAYEVSRGTLREALKRLEWEGLVRRRQRAGTTISARPRVAHPLQRNGGVQELIEASGRRHGVRDAQLRFAVAPAEVARHLELPAAASVAILERVRTADGTPVIFTVDHLPLTVVGNAAAPLLPEVSLYEWLAAHCGIEIAYGVSQLKAITAEPDVAARLDVGAGTPLLQLRQVDFTATGDPVLFSEELHVADAFDVTVVRNGPFGAG